MARTMILTPAKRQGTFFTSSYDVPTGLSGPIKFLASMLDNEYEDTDNSLSINVFSSDDAGATWQHVMGLTWEGGPVTGRDGESNPEPTITTDISVFAGKLSRAEISVPVEMRFSIYAETL